MSVWRNEQDFMSNMDNKLSEFYIKDKKITTSKKLNVQTQKPGKSWYDSESDDEINDKGENADGPSMGQMNTLQMMDSIRMQVRNAVGDRYNNQVLETYYKMDQKPSSELCSSNTATVPFMKPQVNESSYNNDTKVKQNSLQSVNGYKSDVKGPIASTSKLDNSYNGRNKFHTRGKSISNKTGNRGPSRYHNNVAFASLQSKESFNYKSKSEFPPL